LQVEGAHDDHEPSSSHYDDDYYNRDHESDDGCGDGVNVVDPSSSPSKSPLGKKRISAGAAASWLFQWILLFARRFALPLCSIAAWYATNGMNGIAMQSLAGRTTEDSASSDANTSDKHKFADIMSITVAVTALQLLTGAVLGRIMLYAYAKFVPTAAMAAAVTDTTTTTKDPGGITDTCSGILFLGVGKRGGWRETLLLPSLHGVGSLCTNLGFMYGSASLVQIVKLLEPFETLFFTRILLSQDGEGKALTSGVISSMTLTVGAAVSLIKSRKTPPNPASVFFALCSGLALSSRNVLQRKFLGGSSGGGGGSAASTPAKSTSDGGVNAPATVAKAGEDKLAKALTKFTDMSLQSGMILAIAMVPLELAFLLAYRGDDQQQLRVVSFLRNAVDWRVLTWHPLYNAFSMITLSFCTALTHSLLNAGKRVFAIVMAILWFRESFTAATATGLLLITVGGCWYTAESKDVMRGISSWYKPALTFFLLSSFYTSILVDKTLIT